MFAQRMVDRVLRLGLVIPTQRMVDHVLRLDLLIPAQRMVDRVLRLGLVIPKTMKLVIVASPLSTQH